MRQSFDIRQRRQRPGLVRHELRRRRQPAGVNRRRALRCIGTACDPLGVLRPGTLPGAGVPLHPGVGVLGSGTLRLGLGVLRLGVLWPARFGLACAAVGLRRRPPRAAFLPAVVRCSRCDTTAGTSGAPEGTGALAGGGAVEVVEELVEVLVEGWPVPVS